MLTSNFSIQIISNFSDIATKNVIVEVRHEKNFVDILSKFSVDISENVEQKILHKSSEEKHFIFYSDSSQISQIILFFPDENNLFDDRSEICKNFSENVTFVPDGDIIDAFEIFSLSVYNFRQYKTEKKNSQKCFFVENEDELEEIQKKIPLLESVYIARNLVNMSPQDLNPETIVHAISDRKWKNFDVEVYGNALLRELWCNLIRAVGKWSSKESFMVILKPKNTIPDEVYGFIGKGVTFDAGGLQIKPDKAMFDMKCDMAGAAAILWTALYLDSLDNLPVNTVFGMAFAENMTGSSAFKPLDVYTAYNGKTVEIHHTDAEWRLVLADVMSYVEKNFHANHIITVATLTGSCLHALGNDIAGIMGDDEKLIEKFLQNSSEYEPVWRLPQPKSLRKSLESDVADIKNIADSVYMGSSLGAAFLSYFQGKAKLTHIDMAGPAYRTKSWGYIPAGGTGWWVKKISEIIQNLS